MKITLFVTYVGRIHTICSSRAYDITLAAEISSHYVRHTVTKHTFHRYVLMKKRNNISVCFGLVYTIFSLRSSVS
jgi:hypothetical protein